MRVVQPARAAAARKRSGNCSSVTSGNGLCGSSPEGLWELFKRASIHGCVEEIRDERRLPPPPDEHAEMNERGDGEDKARRPFHAAEGNTGWK
jgi:hypothetical protein